MKNLITDPLTLELGELYIAMIYFLEEYNEKQKSDDLRDLQGELEQFHITQWGFKEWQNTLKAMLIKTGQYSDSEMHDMSGTYRWSFK